MAEGKKRPKILMAKPGRRALDGLVVVSKALRDAGYEIVYAGT